jgi:hypothetical protein
MALFPMSGVLRGFPSAEYYLYASTKTLVRPCSSEKLLIYELETYRVPDTCYVIDGWALSIGNYQAADRGPFRRDAIKACTTHSSFIIRFL